MHFALPPLRRPRHPLARALSLLVGLALAGVLLVFGLVVAGVLLVGGALLLAWRQWTHHRRPGTVPGRSARRPQTLEGEYVVIHPNRHHTAH